MSKPKLQVIGPRDVLKQPRIDGWENLVTLLGTSADKRTASRLNWENHDPEFYEQMYAGGGIPARIVDLIPDESLREWVDWTNVDPGQAELIEERCEELDVRGALLKGWTWGRAYGGGAVYIATDTNDPASPLRRGERVIGLRDLSRWDLRILTTDIEYDFASPNFGRPNIYYLNVQMGSQYKGYPIHWTRMIRFDGQLVPRRTYIRNNYWHDSILNRLWPVIRDYEMSNDAAAAVLQDFSVDVFSMKNLSGLMGSGKEATVRNRMEMIQYAKSVLNMMIIDADLEQYENKGRSIEGVAELLNVQANRLVAQTDIPHTKLLGESPDGSNATGNSTSQNWYNFIGSEQTNYLKPKLKRIISILFPELPRLGFKFRPLRKLDALEEADLRLKQSTVDKNYYDAGVLDSTEIAQSRFGGEEYSTDTKLNLEARSLGLIGAGSPEPAAPPAVDEDGNPVKQPPPGAEGEEPDSGPDNEGNPKPGAKGKPPTPGKPGIPGASAPPAPQQPKGPIPGAPGSPSSAAAGQGSPIPQGAQPGALNAAPDAPGEATEGATAEEASPGDDPELSAEHEAGVTGNEFASRNAEAPPSKNPKPAVGNIIGPVEGLPMRDPKTDPKIKGPGIPNKARTILSTVGTGITAPSGGDPSKPQQATTEGVQTAQPSEKPTEQELPELYQATVKKKTDAGESVFMQRGLDQTKKAAPKRASTIIVKRGDYFLMGRRRDTGRWTLPGGHVDGKESHHQGAVRELAEETGLMAKRLKFLGARMVEPKQGLSVHLNMYEHQADDEAKITGKLDPDRELAEFRWLPLKGPLPDEISGNLQHPNNVALAHLGLL